MSSYGQRAVAYFGVIGSIASVIALYWTFWQGSGKEGVIGMVLLSSFAWFFFAFSLIQEIRYSRKARYAESVYLISDIYNSCVTVLAEGKSDTESVQGLVRSVCSDLAHAFGIITGARCSVCVKVLNSNPGRANTDPPRLVVSTLCRDKDSANTRDYDPQGVVHYLQGNSDFRELFDYKRAPRGECFFENDLPARSDYGNTSFQIYGEPKDIRIPMLRGIIRNFWWPLPYRSTIVVPILPMAASAATQIVGFLCADCTSRGVFKRRYDIDLMRGVAAALYPVVFRWTEAVSVVATSGTARTA